MIKLREVSSRVRRIAVKNIGRDKPALLITNDLTTADRDLFVRYAERMMAENELDAYIGGFHLYALTSGVPLNVDLDATLTVVAGNLYRAAGAQATPVRERHPRPDLAGLPRRHRHPAHRRRRRHLRAEPAQPPSRPHQRRLRRSPSINPLVGRTHAARPGAARGTSAGIRGRSAGPAARPRARRPPPPWSGPASPPGRLVRPAIWCWPHRSCNSASNSGEGSCGPGADSSATRRIRWSSSHRARSSARSSSSTWRRSADRGLGACVRECGCRGVPGRTGVPPRSGLLPGREPRGSSACRPGNAAPGPPPGPVP